MFLTHAEKYFNLTAATGTTRCSVRVAALEILFLRIHSLLLFFLPPPLPITSNVAQKLMYPVNLKCSASLITADYTV